MSPAAQLAGALAERREQEIPFEFAWSACFDEINWPTDHTERKEWRSALLAARAEFEDAYERPGEQPAFVRRLLARAVVGEHTGAQLVAIAAGGGQRVRLLGYTVASPEQTLDAVAQLDG